tara:strand:- start:1004 stop:2131 length:1128 start_codon:yes stop_codon:yes gene_type:complete
MKGNILKNEYGSSVLLVLLVTILFTGINGIIAFTLFILFSNFNFGRDPDYKHGLSSGKSRLGGAAIFLSIIIGCCSHLFFFNDLSSYKLLSEVETTIIISFLIGLIGLAEDLSQNLSSQKRLIIMLIFVGLGLHFQPTLLPFNLEIFDLLGIKGSFIPIYIFSVIMVCGFINAGNMADGANGLLASIFFSFFVISYTLDSSIFNFSVLITLLAFIVFNVLTGKIFLGDFGAYFLSSLVAFKSLEFYENLELSVFFLASILIYPCFELARSIIIRSMKSVSLINPDNNHLHNHINRYILSFKFSKHTANSLTGLSIGVLTSFIPLSLYFSGLSVMSNYWKLILCLQILCLSVIYIYFEKISQDGSNHCYNHPSKNP